MINLIKYHEGFLGGGHYYARTKHRKTMLWNSFDDDIVSQCKIEEDVVSADAYILFYSKMSPDEIYR